MTVGPSAPPIMPMLLAPLFKIASAAERTGRRSSEEAQSTTANVVGKVRRGNMLFPYSGSGNPFLREDRSMSACVFPARLTNLCAGEGCVSEIQSPGEETRKDSPGKATGSCTSVRRRERSHALFPPREETSGKNIQPAAGS